MIGCFYEKISTARYSKEHFKIHSLSQRDHRGCGSRDPRHGCFLFRLCRGSHQSGFGKSCGGKRRRTGIELRLPEAGRAPPGVGAKIARLRAWGACRVARQAHTHFLSRKKTGAPKRKLDRQQGAYSFLSRSKGELVQRFSSCRTLCSVVVPSAFFSRPLGFGKNRAKRRRKKRELQLL